MTRRLVAIGGVVLVILAFGLLLKSCVDTQRRNGLKDYNDQVNRLGTESTSNVAQALDVLLNANGDDALAQAQNLNDLAADGDTFTVRARELSTPGGLEAATQNVATALSLRHGAVERIADEIGKARGTSATEQEAATQQIAGQMTALLASDVLWQARVTPFIKDKFKDDDLNSESITPSVVLKDAAWTNTATVANRIGGVAPDEAGDDPSKEIAPGTHGHGLSAVTINGKALVAGGVTNVANPSGTNVVVTIENQGENDEEDVTVAVSGTSQSTNKSVFNQTKKLASSLKGTKTPVTIPITKTVTGSVKVTVEVKKVGGEENVENNKGTYNVIFTK